MRPDNILAILATLLTSPTNAQDLDPPTLPSTPPLASLPPLPAQPQLPSQPPLPQLPPLPDLPEPLPPVYTPQPFSQQHYSPNAFPPPPCRTFFCLHQPPQLIVTVQWHETADTSTAGSDDQEVLTLTNIASNKILMAIRFDILVAKLEDLVGDIGDALGLGDDKVQRRDERRDLLAMTATLLPTASAPLVFEMATAIVTSWIQPVIEEVELTVQTVGGPDESASDAVGNMTTPTGRLSWGSGLPMGTGTGLPWGTGLSLRTATGLSFGTGLPNATGSPVNRAAVLSLPGGTGTQLPTPITTTMTRNAPMTPTPRLLTGTGRPMPMLTGTGPSIPLLTGTGPAMPMMTGTNASLPAWMSMFLPASATSTTALPTSLFYLETGPATRVTRTLLRVTASSTPTAVSVSS